jgi:hypothetical protein
MSKRRLVRWLGSVVIAALLFAPNARGEVAAWNQAQVTTLAKVLTTATDALYDTFSKKPPPDLASMQMNAYCSGARV